MIMLMTSSPVSSARVASTATQNEQDFTYSVSVSPPVARVQQNDFQHATFDVKVLRGSDVGQFSVRLSLVSDSSILKTIASFDPPILNFKQGQTFANSTLRVNSQEFELGTIAFRVQAATQPPAIPDRALSNPATIVIRAAEPESKLTTSESLPSERTPKSESIPSKLTYPPIAKAGQDQIIQEGERGVLDGSASIDKDKDALSFLWQQISPRQPIIKLYPSDASSRVAFVAPDVIRDTTFRFNLVVKDINGGQAVDSINILTTNVEKFETPNSLPKPEGDQTQKEQNQEKPTSQKPALNTDTTTSPTSNQVPTSTENHSPTADAQQVLLTDEAKSLSITLKGNDPDKDDKISYVVLSNPTHGTIAGFDKTTGSLIYLPTSGFVGQDRLTYKVIDSHDAESNAGVVVIRVRATSQSASSPAPTDSTLDNSSSASPSETPSSETPSSPDNRDIENATSASIGALALDETAPEVISTEPEDLAPEVPVNSVIKATFSEPMNPDTFNANTFRLDEQDPIEGTFPVAGTISLIDDDSNAIFTPTASLTAGTKFFAHINGDSSPSVEDAAGNSMGSDVSWSFTTATTTPEISMTLYPALPKWGQSVEAQGTATGAGEGDIISIDWGDGTVTEISPVPSGGDFVSPPHVYEKPTAVSGLEKTVVAKLLTSDGESEVERAATTVLTTIQKHATSLTLGMSPSPDSAVCSSCHFTTFGKLVDRDGENMTMPNGPEIGGKTITFSGSGSSTLDSVPTEGLTFTAGDYYNDLTLTSSVLRMHVGSQVDLSYSGVTASGVTLDFQTASGSSVGVTLTKAVAPFDTVSMTIPVGSPQNADFAKGFSKLTITSIDGSSSPSEYADLATIITRDVNIENGPQEQHEIHFNNVVPDPGQYPVLVINPGSYFAAGVTQEEDANGLKITAQFDGTNDPAYSGATSPELSYNVDSSAAGTGTGDTTTDDTTVWTKLTVGFTTSGDVCTFNGVAGTDNDKDNICDRWENPSTPSPGPGLPANSATHRYVTCPTTAGHAAAIDPQCPITPGQAPSIMYDLCNPTCPTLGKKDIYVEIDSKTGFVPSDTAINNVIKAFANAPAPNGPITLHVKKDATISTIPNNLFVWKDPASLNYNDNIATNDFFNIKKTNFGTAAERGGSSGMPGMTAAGWSSTGKTLKHYFTHYGLSVNFYSKTSGLTCPAGGLSSGVGELLGNDFVVSLGCGWGTFDSSARSNAQQAGTIMHELGHNLNLHHGGPAKIIVGSRTSADYLMNCKPNYPSVMNYARQMPWDLVGPAGVDAQDIANWEGDKLADGSFNYRQDAAKYSTMLDFSGTTLPNQNEGSINEAAGTTAADGKKYRIVYLKTTPGTVALGTDGANFDFSGNGQIATIPGDINSLGSKVVGCGPLSPETENSYNDWNEINLVFLPDPDSQDGVTTSNIIEVTPSFAAAIKAKAYGLQVQFIPPPNTDGSSIFNVGGTVPLKFRLTDANGQFIRNAAVTFVAEKGSTKIEGSFVYNLAQELYKFDWKTLKTAQYKGQWTISYFKDYKTPNQVLLTGPQAQASGGLFTLKITGK